jgi:ribosome-associated protein
MLKIRPGLAIPLAEIAFSADTSGGKGGQHANRSSTRVELRFDVLGSPSLSARQRALIAEKLGPRLARDGTLRVVSAAERSQLRNRRAALERLAELLARGLERPAPRTATKPTRASKAARVAVKKHRATVKEGRKRPATDD